MTLDEAIAHCKEVSNSCHGSCGIEHNKLMLWLIELKELRASAEQLRKCIDEGHDYSGTPACKRCGYTYKEILCL